MSKTKKQSFDVQFMFTHGYNWITIEAETAKQALCRAEDIVAEDGERYDEIRGDASNYDDIGEVEAIEVKGVHETLDWTSDEVNLHSAAAELLEELQAAVLVYEDIVAAMGTDDPYTLDELTSKPFAEGFTKARAAIAKAKGGAA
jgi:predicted lipid-binding transport protein (Tim44 family)